MAALDLFSLFRKLELAQVLGPGMTPTQITAGAGDLASKPRFIHVGAAAGSVTYVANGVTITETLEVGYHPISPDKITAIAAGTTVVAWT